MNSVDPEYEWEKAEDAFNNGDIAGALFVLKKMERNGSKAALVEIGNIYETGGVGVERNYEEARNWYERAVVELDDPLAYWALGRFYYGGIGVKQNYEKAFFYFSAIENEERPGVLYALGTMYECGFGVLKNKEIALSYYQRSADLGNLLGLKQLGLLTAKQGHFFLGMKIYVKAFFLIFKVVLRNPNDERVKVI